MQDHRPRNRQRNNSKALNDTTRGPVYVLEPNPDRPFRSVGLTISAKCTVVMQNAEKKPRTENERKATPVALGR